MRWPPEMSTRDFFKFGLGRLGFATNSKKCDCKAKSGRSRSEKSSIKAEADFSPVLESLPPHQPVQTGPVQYLNNIVARDPVSRSDGFLNSASTWGKPGYIPCLPSIWEIDRANLNDMCNVPKVIGPPPLAKSASEQSDSQPSTMTFESGETDITDVMEEPPCDWVPPSWPELNNSLLSHDTNMLLLIQEPHDYNFSPPFTSPTQPKWEQTDGAFRHDQPLESHCNPQHIPKSTKCAAPSEDTPHTSPETNTRGRSSLDLPVGVQRCKNNHSDCEHSVAAHCPDVDAGSSMSHRAGEGSSGLSSLASNHCLPSGSEMPCEDDEFDSDPAWMSDYSSDEAMSLEENHPFLVLKAEVIRRGLLLHAHRRCATNEDASTADSSSLPTGQGPQSGRTKRRDSDQDDETPQEKRDDGDISKKRQKVTKKSGRRVSLACPFAKKDPLKYRGCYGYVLKRTQDVKQHLSRSHQLPIYCPRCRVEFHLEEERDNHARTVVCQPSDLPVFEGVTRAQKEQLTRRVSARMSLEDQWFTIFDVLFPGHNPRPRSAFVNADLTEDLEVFQDLMMTEGPDIIAECIRTSQTEVPPLDDNEHNRYSLLRGAIAEGLQNIAQMWTTRLFLDAAATGASTSNPTVQSTSSHSSHLTNNSQPSQASSGTLVEFPRQLSLSERLALLGEETDCQPRGQEPGTTMAGTAEMECLSFTINGGSRPAAGSVSSGVSLQNELYTSIDAVIQPFSGGAMDDDITKAILHYIQDCTDDQEAADT